MLDTKRLSLSNLIAKTVVVHTATYFAAGILAYTLGGYEKTFSEPPLTQMRGLWEVLLQSFLLSFLLFYWVNHPEKRWLSWTMGSAFCIVMILPLLGLLARAS